MDDRVHRCERTHEKQVRRRVRGWAQAACDHGTGRQIDDRKVFRAKRVIPDSAWLDRENPGLAIGDACVPERQDDETSLDQREIRRDDLLSELCERH
jgi:hypothetical protein